MGHPDRIKLLRMIRKNDYALAATSARSYNRHWRAKKLTWNEIGKIKYLFDGAIEYMDEVTLAYTSNSFNKLRVALGFKQDSELTELIVKSDAFRIVRNKDTHQMEAFMSPLVTDRFVPTENQEIEEPAIAYNPLPTTCFTAKPMRWPTTTIATRYSKISDIIVTASTCMCCWLATCPSFTSSPTRTLTNV